MFARWKTIQRDQFVELNHIVSVKGGKGKKDFYSHWVDRIDNRQVVDRLVYSVDRDESRSEVEGTKGIS